MKTNTFVKFTPLFLLGFLFLIFSCRKACDDEPQYEILLHGITYWECNVIEVDTDTTRYFYHFSLNQEGNQLSGEIIIRDSATLVTGAITGRVENDILYFTSVFPDGKFNFSFEGILEDSTGQNCLSGQLQSKLLAGSANEEFPVLISPALDFHCPDFFPTNPSVFRKVNSSNNPGDSVIIFIHGMTGDLTHWDDMIDKLSNELTGNHDIYLFQYNWKDSIMVNGRILLDSVTEAGLTHPIIVAHSMGGLVARAYVAHGGETSLLITLGTPHLGSPLAKLSNIICFMDFPGSSDMKPEGGFIQSLLTNTNDIQNRNKYVLFAGQMKGKFKIVKFRIKWVWAEDYYDIVDKIGYDAFVLFGSPDNDGLVPVNSAFFEGYEALERKPLLEWVDHKNLRNPAISDEVIDFINAI